MQPKSYKIFKWTIYGLATFLMLILQSLVLNQIRILGTVPFLYPVLPALVAMFEGGRRGPVFALTLGVVCALLLPAPFPGFFPIAFTLAAVLSARVAENLLSTGFFCGLLVSALSLLLTGGLRILTQLLSGGGYLELMARIVLIESAITLPAVIVAFPLYRVIHKRCAVDY